jgi:hypothetical protein
MQAQRWLHRRDDIDIHAVAAIAASMHQMCQTPAYILSSSIAQARLYLNLCRLPVPK